MTSSTMLGAVLVLATSMTLGARAVPGLAGEPTWEEHVRAMDFAIAAGDALQAQHELQRAYVVATGSRRWEALLAVGDASRRCAQVPGAQARAVQWARRSYLAAMFRARDARALDGIAAAVEGFAALGDHDIVVQGLRMADGVARRHGNANDIARVHALAERLAERSLVSGELRLDP